MSIVITKIVPDGDGRFAVHCVINGDAEIIKFSQSFSENNGGWHPAVMIAVMKLIAPGIGP